jgi:predicted small lipoprotein YifL
MMQRPLILSVMLLFAALSGCGTKTSLVLPAGPVTAPLFGGSVVPPATFDAHPQSPLDNSNKKTTP